MNMNIDLLVKIIGVVTLIGTVSFHVIKYIIKKRMTSKQEVIDFLIELDKSIITFESKKIKWTQPISRLFEWCSVKSEECRYNGTGMFPYESKFVNFAVRINNWDKVPFDIFNGAVAISINNSSELQQFIKRGLLPKCIRSINLEPLLKSHHIYIDCKKTSLNDLILSYKRAFLRYNSKLVGQFKWLKWQPHI